jgi:signal-transduction protein with cAMP-binding, CBS, and nucleotidyltransferase domain/PAS domain-containing protein
VVGSVAAGRQVEGPAPPTLPSVLNLPLPFRRTAGRARPYWRHFAVNIISPAILTFALFLGFIFAVIVPAMKRATLERKKEMIRELTQLEWSELAGLHEREQRGELDRAAAQRAAIERIRRLRFGDDGKDYFWISDLQTRMVVHPYRPDLDGQDLSTYADPAGRRLFVEFTRLARTQGAGYLEYLWQWKDDEHRVVPKLSYVKGFEPWGWIVGTGIYLEDVRAEIGAMTRRVLWFSLGLSGAMAALLAYIAKQGLDLERQRWQAERALRDSEERYRMLVEGSAEGVLLVLQERPAYANKTLLDRLGYSAAELVEVPLEKVVEPLTGGAAGPGPDRRARLFDRHGTATEVLLTSASVNVGEQTGQMLTFRDLAARRQRDETLARLVADLQSLLPLATRAIKASPPTLVACDLDTTVSQAAAMMARARTSAILVRAAGGEPIGIVTDQDLRNRVLAEGRSAAGPVAAIMSAPLIRIPARSLLFEAARVMQERGVRHLVVTDDAGATLGVLTSSEILHAQRHAVALLLGEIQAAGSPEALRDSRAKLPVFVRALLESGARVETVTRIMTTVSDAIAARLLALAEAELGPPPAAFAFVVLGSEAREEQTFATDQDNALLYAEVPAGQQEAAQTYFLRLGEKVCAGLDLAGYRRCPGEVMACNPKWCQPLPRWRQYFADCVAAARPQDLLDVNVFFDLRCAHGAAELVAQLRQHLHEQFAADPRHAFFFHLAQSTLQFRAPRGFFGNIQLEAAGDEPARFNVKSAIIPLVNFARMYALRHGYAETNTLDRLRRLRDDGRLVAPSHDELAQAYGALMQMRLAHQAAQVQRGEAPDNAIDLQKLTQLERSMLKKIFADIAVFQARLETDFARTS